MTPDVGSSDLGDINKFLPRTLGGSDWLALQPGLRPAIPTQQATGWATEPVRTQWRGWDLSPPPANRTRIPCRPMSIPYLAT